MSEFIEVTEIAERSIRRLAESRGCSVTRNGDTYTCCGVEMTDDEAWDCLSALPQVASRRGR